MYSEENGSRHAENVLTERHAVLNLEAQQLVRTGVATSCSGECATKEALPK